MFRGKYTYSSATYFIYLYSLSAATISGQAFVTGLEIDKSIYTQKIYRDNLSSAPRNFKSILKYTHRDRFLQAIYKEYTDLERYRTWRSVPRPKTGPQTQILPVIQIFTYKFDPYSYLIKYKARLVVYSDLYIFIYNNIYTAILALYTFCSIMVIVAIYNLETI